MRVLSAVALAAIALPAFAAPVRIERVDVGRGPSPVVRLHLSGPAGARSRVPCRPMATLRTASTSTSMVPRSVPASGRRSTARARWSACEPDSSTPALRASFSTSPETSPTRSRSRGASSASW